MSTEERIVRNLFTVPIKNMILLIIGLRGEAHGYEILKEIEKISSGIWKPSHGNLYTMLNKMVEEGLVEPKEEYQGKRRRVKYRLTEKGWKWLQEANELALKSLYIAIEYHEQIRKRLQERGYRREFEKEAIEEYLNILDGIIQILETKRRQLRKMLEEKEVKGTGS
ncbi:PadR family transcriptional regulator [Thermococcus stetteri]|uniref:PadR family transcriptional regulator n=1 Tax=Thermococcus stetteri TaxID=49900 RepID=UPI001AE15166|nr:PadR family transcriptional regulator [Thermococcus stetteri]MBP1911318.1 DNA-binding PadR family transcriptional regulator [Thermococcus stetteri]